MEFNAFEKSPKSCITLSRVMPVIDYRIIWKSNLSNKTKIDYFQTVAVFIVLYGCTTWTLTKCIEKKLKWKHKITARRLAKFLEVSPHKIAAIHTFFSLSIQVKRRRYEWNWWKSKKKLKRDVILCTLANGCVSVRWEFKTCSHQHCGKKRFSIQDEVRVRNHRMNRFMEFCAANFTWGWWYIYIYIYMCVCACVCVCARVCVC